MIIRVRHMNVVCKDLEKSMEFYVDKLGGKPDRDKKTALTPHTDPGIGSLLGFKKPATYMACLVRYGADTGEETTVVDLLQWLNPKPHGNPYESMSHVGIARVCFLVDDVDRMYAELKSKGVEFINPPEIGIVFWGTRQIKACCCYDPDGIVITLEQRIKGY